MNLGESEKQVVELLKREDMDCDELSRALKWPAEKTSIVLSELTLKGVIEENNAKFMVV
jgi:predicted Rossmann fold nucleotide-binding protein DprA/Smf involved in DNA uptake